MKPMPLEKEKLSDSVAEKLVHYIIDNKLQPGDLLPSEKELVDSFQIGKTSVREGVSKLKSIGLLSSAQGYGCVINEVTFSDFMNNIESSILLQFVKLDPVNCNEIAETRKMLELYALQHSIISEEKMDLLQINMTVRKMGKLSNPADFELFKQLDFDFHQQIIDLLGNPSISKIYSFIRCSFLPLMVNYSTFQNMTILQKEHETILDGIYKKDMDVVALLGQHLDRYAFGYH